MSKRVHSVVFTACSIIALGLPTQAITESGAPLRISTCNVAYMMGVPGYADGFTDGVTVTVTNLSPRTITSFEGGGIYNNTLITDTITHTIAPRDTYTFKKRYKPFFYSKATAPCYISKVTFDDGTTWTAPKTAP